ncbi:MAG: type IV pilus assembly protein PilM [Elusimicrobia bacterium]|nr:type IV pilus assembly protein PilM [Elusimicrobiota bacterium]
MPIKLDKVKEALGEALKKAKGFSEFLMGSPDLLAVDMGNYAIKIAHVKQESAGPVLKTWGHLPLNIKPEATADERKAQTINSLKAFLVEKGVKIKDAATTLSGNSVIVRYVKFPRLTKTELAATLPTEAEPFIPFDINEVQLGAHILSEITEEGQKKMETVLVAAKKDLIAARLEILQAAGLFPTIVDVDSFALENIYERLRDPKSEMGATLYLNLGHMVTNLSIIENGVTRVVRDIFISGATLTKAITKAMQNDFMKAEELKKAHGIVLEAAEKEKAVEQGQQEALAVSQTIVTVVKDLVGEVHRSVDFYLSQGAERSIGRIVLMGGTAKVKNLAKHLTAELKVPVSVLDPLSFLKQIPADFPKELAPDFAVALGLALRRNRDWV